MRVASLILLSLMVYSAGCSDDDDDSVTGTAGGETTTARDGGDTVVETEEPTATTRTVVGQVQNIQGAINPVALVDESDAFLGREIFTASRISTDAGGDVLFNLEGFVTCDTRQNSSLEVFPTGNVVIRWLGSQGVSFCAKVGQSEQTYSVNDEIQITMTDPIFGVILEETQTTIKMVSGTATIVDGSGVEFELGADDQLVVPDGERPFSQELFLSEVEIEVVDRLRQTAPLPDLTVGFDAVITGDNTCEIVYTVANLGREAARTTAIGVEIDGFSRTDEVSAVDPGEEVQQSTVFDIDCPFTPDLSGLLTIDPDDDIAEADETNNSAPINIVG